MQVAMSRTFPDPEKSSRKPARRPSKETGAGSFMGKLSERMETLRETAVVEPIKIEPGRRLMALGIDFGASFLLSMVLVTIPLLGRFITQQLVILAVMLGRDYLFEGRGIGKNLMGLKVVDMASGERPGIKQVLIRNGIYLGPLLLIQIVDYIVMFVPLPEITSFAKQAVNLLASLYVLVIVPVEAYRSYQSKDSMRLGDALAGTCLLETDMNFNNLLPKKD
jgi:hypothetical protein